MDYREKYAECKRLLDDTDNPHCNITLCVDCEFNIPYEVMKEIDKEEIKL